MQRELCDKVQIEPLEREIQYVGGCDLSYNKGDDQFYAGVVVLDYETMELVAHSTVTQRAPFPYVPGLLSFREVPVLLQVLRRLQTPVGGLLCDGQGIAHPRRLGLATHLGLIAGLPTVGCAKSRLCGTHREPGRRRGAVAPLMDEGERIGSVLRTRDGVKPLYVSPGHLSDHASSIEWVLACGAGYRLPEPTRLADRLVAEYKKTGRYRGGLTRRAI